MAAALLILLVMVAVGAGLNPSREQFAWFIRLRRPAWLTFEGLIPLIWIAIYACFYASALLSWNASWSWGLMAGYLGLLVLVVDEAHRLNRFSGLYGNQGENQVKEIINASHLSVFFLDEDQQVAWKDIGTEAEIRAHASALGAEVIIDELPSQFRCAGSDGYLAWLDDLLGIRATANPELDRDVFDFRLFESPGSLHAAIRQANTSNRARLVAGYCWNWSSKKNLDLNDIVLPEHSYAARWNLKAEDNSWIISPTGVEEVGCVHTCQGLEVDTIGVIIGPDLVFRDGQLQANASARAHSDKSLTGWRAAMATDPTGTEERLSRLIRNTYRTLMSRGMKSCWVFACDPELQGYLRQRLN